MSDATDLASPVVQHFCDQILTLKIIIDLMSSRRPAAQNPLAEHLVRAVAHEPNASLQIPQDNLNFWRW